MSRRALPVSLRAYLALTRGGGGGSVAKAAGAPTVWMHLSDPAERDPALGWHQQLTEAFGRVRLVLTGAGDGTVPADVQALSLPEDLSGPVNRFLAANRPALCIWSGNRLRPRLILSQAEQCGHVVLIHASTDPFHAPRPFFGNAGAALLPVFSRVFALDAAALRHVRTVAPELAHAETGGRLQHSKVPLGCRVQSFEQRATELSGRPVWLAAGVAAEETDTILRAHRRASRMAHRLLLLVAPAPGVPDTALVSAAQDMGLRVRLWGDVPLSEDAVQVIVVPDPGQLGLLYRLAPVTFLGGSLTTAEGGTDPYQAAALGSAILYGPHVSGHVAAYDQLARAGAALLVRDTDALANALGTLLAPDAAAAMAHAGWEVLSSGAPMAETLLDVALDALNTADGS